MRHLFDGWRSASLSIFWQLTSNNNASTERLLQRAWTRRWRRFLRVYSRERCMYHATLSFARHRQEAGCLAPSMATCLAPVYRDTGAAGSNGREHTIGRCFAGPAPCPCRLATPLYPIFGTSRLARMATQGPKPGKDLFELGVLKLGSSAHGMRHVCELPSQGMST